MSDFIGGMKIWVETTWNEYKWYFIAVGAAIVLLAVLVLT